MDKKKLYERLANEELSMEDIFTDDFIKENSDFSSFKSFIDELEERGNKNKVGTEKILQTVISEKTNFKNFEKMKEAAIEYYCQHN